MRPISDIVRQRQVQSGFTLVEMIVAITITAILSGIVVLFIKVPLDSYFDVSRRAELTDAADLAVRRATREVQGALPNSVRVTSVAGVTYLEFLAVRTGGRYRAQPSGGTLGCSSGNDTLEIGLVDSCFRTMGAIPGRAGIVTGSDSVVVFNLGPGFTGANAYAAANLNRSVINATADGGASNEDRIEFDARTFQLASPSQRFFVISGPVTYVCAPAAGGGTLARYWGYAIQEAQPNDFTAAPLNGAANALLATGVTACTIIYDASAAASRNGVVSISLTLTRTDPNNITESVSLFSQAHVVNSP